MTPEELAMAIADMRRRADAGSYQNTPAVEGLCKEAERLVERVRGLETELRVSQLRARSAEGIAVMNS